MKYFFTLILMSFCQGSQATQFVFDFDDTVKVSHVSSKPKLIWNALYSYQEYLGMSDLIKELLKNPKNEVTVISASPQILRANIEMFFEWKGVPVRSVSGHGINVVLKDSFLDETYDYKLKMIENLISQSGYSEEIVLVGDNVEKDQDIYNLIADRHPEKAVYVYIHRVESHAGAKSQIRGMPYLYSMTLELATGMLKSGFLSKESWLQISKAMLQKYQGDLFTGFVYCPKKIYIDEMKGHLDPFSFEVLYAAFSKRLKWDCP